VNHDPGRRRPRHPARLRALPGRYGPQLYDQTTRSTSAASSAASGRSRSSSASSATSRMSARTRGC
jgi:hypothetical protein